MDSDADLQLHGTTRILTENEHVKLVPEPTDSPNDPLNCMLLKINTRLKFC